jgi:hypothetical protein
MPAQLAAHTAKPQPGVLHALTALTRLCLQDVQLLGQDHSQHLTALARLPDLQHLHMDVHVAEVGGPARPVLTLDVLQQLLPLTYLHIQLNTDRRRHWYAGEVLPEGVSRVLAPDAAQHLGRLTRLQHLGICSHRYFGNTQEVLLFGHVSQLLQLTQLTYLGLGPVLNCQLPALSGLGVLQQLELRGCRRVSQGQLDSPRRAAKVAAPAAACKQRESGRPHPAAGPAAAPQ